MACSPLHAPVRIRSGNGGRGSEVAQSLVQVAGLVMAGLLVAIEVVAHA